MENGRIKVWLPAVRTGSGSDVFTLRLAAALEKYGLKTHITWYSKWDELLPLRMISTLPPLNIDAILANSWTGYAFRRNKLPLITVVHHAIFDSALDTYKSIQQRFYHRYLAEPRERCSLSAADAIISVSAYVAEHIQFKYGITDSRIIHNWVDIEKYRPLQQSGKEGRPFRLLFVGRPTALKGGSLLAPIMRLLGSGFELWITATQNQGIELGLPNNTSYLGRLDESALIEVYQQCDALLCPSYSEGFGYATLEAMACGIPVIARTGSGTSELIQDGVNGILCEGGIESFAGACQSLVYDTNGYLQLAASARNLAVNNFSEAEGIPLYVDLIKRNVLRSA